MARLPQPGKDVGTWGIVLNDYLNQSHNADGSIKNNVVTPAALAGNIPQSKITNLQTDISSKVDKVTGSRLITSAESTLLGNTSNTNSGDNATNSQYSGLAASKEDVANKVTSLLTPTDTQYPSAKLVSDQLALKQANLGYTPENVLNKDIAGGYAGLDVNGNITKDILEIMSADFLYPSFGPELLNNKSFDTWTTINSGPELWGFTKGNNDTIERLTGVDVHSGTYAVKITVGATPTGYSPNIVGGGPDSTGFVVEPGATYTIGFWCHGDGTHSPGYGVYDKTHVAYITSLGTTLGVTGTTWTYVTKTFVAPAGCLKANIFLSFAPGGTPTTGSSFYFDDVSCKKNIIVNGNGVVTPLQTILNYLPAGGVKYNNAVTGFTATDVQAAINELYSKVAILPISSPNITGILTVDYNVETFGNELVLNPGFETLSSPYWANWVENPYTGTIEKETSFVHSGANACKLTYVSGAWYAPQVTQAFVTESLTTYEVSFWTAGDGTNAGNYAIYDSTHLVYLIGAVTTGITANSYTKVTVRFTTTAGGISTTLFLLSKGSTANSYCYFDDISLKKVINTNRNGLATDLQSILNNFPSEAIKFTGTGMTSTNVKTAILEAFNSSSFASLTPRIILPDDVTAVVGDTLQLFIRGMIEAQNPYNLPYEVLLSSYSAVPPAVGSYPRYLEITPVAGDVGTKVVTVNVLDLSCNVISTDTMNMVVVTPTGQPATVRNVLCIGDSLTTGGNWPAEMYRRLTQTGGTPAGLSYGNINFIGDNPMPGFAGQAYIGWGGWTWGQYTGGSADTNGHVLTGTFDKDITDIKSYYTDGTVQWIIEYATGGLKIHGVGTLAASGTLTWVSGGTHHSDIVYTAKTDEQDSSLVDTSGFSFTRWAARNSYSTIDDVFVLLGWNGLASGNKYLASDHATMIAQARVFLDKLHTDFPSCKLHLMGLEIPSINGGLPYNYGSTGNSIKFYSFIRSVNGLRLAYQSLANEVAYSSWVNYIDNAVQFDSEWNMSYTAKAVNTRNTTSENFGTNGVHPATNGYLQIADACFRDFIRRHCSS